MKIVYVYNIFLKEKDCTIILLTFNHFDWPACQRKLLYNIIWSVFKNGLFYWPVFGMCIIGSCCIAWEKSPDCVKKVSVVFSQITEGRNISSERTEHKHWLNYFLIYGKTFWRFFCLLNSSTIFFSSPKLEVFAYIQFFLKSRLQDWRKNWLTTFQNIKNQHHLKHNHHLKQKYDIYFILMYMVSQIFRKDKDWIGCIISKEKIRKYFYHIFC